MSHYCQQVLLAAAEARESNLTNLVRPCHLLYGPCCWTLVANDLAPWVATDGAGDIFTYCETSILNESTREFAPTAAVNACLHAGAAVVNF